jgi:hypothetical protein
VSVPRNPSAGSACSFADGQTPRIHIQSLYTTGSDKMFYTLAIMCGCWPWSSLLCLSLPHRWCAAACFRGSRSTNHRTHRSSRTHALSVQEFLMAQASLVTRISYELNLVPK